MYEIFTMGRNAANIDRPPWAERLMYRRLITLRRKSQGQVALDSDILTQRTISEIETGKYGPEQLTAERLAGLARGYEYRDIFEMQDDIGLDFKLGQPPPLLNEVTARDYPDHVLLDIEPLSAAAGMPAYAVESQHSEKYIMPKSHYHPSIRIFTANGDSMAREGGFGIQDGDSLVVDTHELDPRDDKVFIVQDEAGAVVVKRLRNWSGDWWLTSDNPKYPPFKLHEARVLGRVVKAEGERDF
jgi:transcriptional regulator with XRE-family HTH domain